MGKLSFTTLQRESRERDFLCAHNLQSYFNPLSTYSRAKSINSIENLNRALSISLKPVSGGNVFAVACEDAVIRIFDLRVSRTSCFFFIVALSPLQLTHELFYLFRTGATNLSSAEV